MVDTIETHTLEELYGLKETEPKTGTAKDSSPSTLTDAEVIDHVRSAKNGSSFVSLYQGDWSVYPSKSEADFALLGYLKFYTRDPAQLERLWLGSGLQRDKLEREDYIDGTIERALRSVTETYSGPAAPLGAPATSAGGATETAPPIRWTLADLPHGEIAPQLADPFIAPEGTTILYGRGGDLKGMTTTHLTLRMIRAGLQVALIDFENHPREWGRRAYAMGYTNEEQRQVQYRAPFGSYWNRPDTRGHLFKIASIIRDELDEFDVLAIDSYTPATSSGDSMGGEVAAKEFFTGIDTFGKPALGIAHVSSVGDKFPDKPFGSVFVHNLARETWAVARADNAEENPSRVHLELRNKKKNEGIRPRTQFLIFEFRADGLISVTEASGKRKVADVFEEILGSANEPLTAAALVKEYKADTGEAIQENNARAVLSQNKDRFCNTSGVPAKWTLKGRDEDAHERAQAWVQNDLQI